MPLGDDPRITLLSADKSIPKPYIFLSSYSIQRNSHRVKPLWLFRLLLFGIDKHIVDTAYRLGEVVLAHTDDDVELTRALVDKLYIYPCVSHCRENARNSTAGILHTSADNSEDSETVLDVDVVGLDLAAKLGDDLGESHSRSGQFASNPMQGH